MKKNILIIFILLLLLVSCKEEIEFTPSQSTSVNTYKVDIKGAVKFPGIYDIEENMLLIDLVNLAGGFKENADTSNINLALVLEPNQMIYIPSNETITDSLININQATKNELMSLPGIGEAKANKIIEYRTINGSFINIEELKKVSGISEEIYNKIKELVRV